MNAEPQFHFSEAVSRELGCYVYRLIDPRNGETFYVGKGTGNRIFQHAAGVRLDDDEGDQLRSHKYGRIRAIRDARLEVLHVIHRHGLTTKEAFEVEAALMDAYPGLTNVQGGYANGDRGAMNYLEIIDRYNLPELSHEPPHSLVVINVNKLMDRSDRGAIYQLVRFCWRLSKARAQKAEYVVAVVRGVTVGVFRAYHWLPATSENFPNIADDTETHRFGFVGEEASPDIWSFYVGERGKRITQPELKHRQNPIRFWKC